MKTINLIFLLISVLVLSGLYLYAENGYVDFSGTEPMRPQMRIQLGAPAQSTGQTNQNGRGNEAAEVSGYRSIEISNFQFNPGSAAIKTGTTVTWTNQDSVNHTVTSDSGVFGSQTIYRGGSYSYTFRSAGNFTYYCSLHPGMRGVVTVAD